LSAGGLSPVKRNLYRMTENMQAWRAAKAIAVNCAVLP